MTLVELTASNHFTKAGGIEQPLTFLIGFRQYIHYHLHAMKVQLHASMRKKVEQIERVIKLARRDPEGTKTWRESFGGQSQEDRELKEEQKVEQVFVHTK